jgi:hypothetical protein
MRECLRGEFARLTIRPLSPDEVTRGEAILKEHDKVGNEADGPQSVKSRNNRIQMTHEPMVSIKPASM